MTDSEEEILVYAELEDDVEIGQYTSINVLDINSKSPIIQMGDTFFTGKYETPLGTFMFFKESPAPKGVDPLFDKISEKNLEYVCKSRKLVKMEHAYITPNENIMKQKYEIETEPSSDTEIVKFKTYEEAIEKFKHYWISTAPPSEEIVNKESENSSASKSCKMTSNWNQKKMPTLESTFQDLNRKFVKINKRERVKNNMILYSVLNKLLKMMRKCDELFNSMQPKLEYMGSYFDGLRVGHPTEFDINVFLKIPVNYDKITLDSTETQYDYTYIIMPSEFRRLCKNPETANKGFKKTAMWCDKSHRLSVRKFRSWMQSVVDAALSQLPFENRKRVIIINNTKFKIRSKISGPANNITIFQDNNVIDIDLVPTFAFELPKKPTDCKVDFTKKEFEKIKQYFVVPKPTDNDLRWRLTFPFHERLCLEKKNNLKSVIKLIKLLRDSQGFKQLASYYIKTLFLWEVSQTDENFWKTNSLSFLVVHMISKLQIVLSQRKISNYWCPEYNLIIEISNETCQNWSNRLAFLLRNISRNQEVHPHVLKEYFSVIVNN